MERQVWKKMPNRIPVNGTFELTVRCNLRCKMCLFRHDDRENPELLAKELTAEQWIDMARQAAEAGTMSLLITGGEAMLRPDFCEIWEGIYKQGFLTELYTNATLVTPKIMKTLQKYPPHRIGITIYGASPETYEKVCGDKKAFQRALDGIQRLQTLPSRIEFRTTIIKENVQDADNIENLVHQNFGKEHKLIQTRIVTKAVRGACADVESCRLDPEDNVRLAFRRGIQIIKEYVGEAYDERLLSAELCRPIQTKEKKITLFGCNAGMTDYTISWDGQLLGCQMMGNFSVNALKEGLAGAWEAFPYTVQLPPIQEPCQSCEDAYLCNCCVASRYAETGDLGGCPEYVCKDTSIIKNLLEKNKRRSTNE